MLFLKSGFRRGALGALVIAFPLLAIAGTPAGSVIQTVAGNSSVGDGGIATAAILTQPEGVAVDSVGNLYVADADDSRVRRISPGGQIQTVAGTGYSGFNGESGPGIEIQLDHPYGVAVDAAGNLYIADLGNGRVRKLAPGGQLATVAGGGAAIPSVNADGGPALSARLIAPRNVAVDSAGNLYIADFGANQVHRVDPAGILTVLAGAGKAGFSGDNGLARLALLSAPAGLAADASGNVYIADSGNNRVRKVTRGVISTVFLTSTPTGLAVNSAGTLYVAGVNYFGTPAHGIGGGILAHDVAADSAGNLYLVSGSVVQRLGANGILALAAGSGASRYYGGDGGPPIFARLHTPYAIAQDDSGNTYIADTDNNRVRRITTGGIMTTFAGTGEAGSGIGNGTAMLAQLNSPRGLAVDSLRNVFIADSGNNRILVVSVAGSLAVFVDRLSDPEALAIDGTDNLFIADTGNNRVLKATPAGVVSTVTEVLHPAGLAIDQAGTLFISEKVRVSKLPNGRLLSTVIDGLQNPRGLALTADGDLIIAEAGLHRVRVVSAAGIVSTIAGTGVAGYSGDDGLAAAAQLNTPSGVWVDAFGRIWIADSGNQRVRMLKPQSTVAPPLTQMTIVNAATLKPGPIAPEEIVTIFGLGFDSLQTQVLFDGAPATLFYVSDTQINALVPASVTPGGYADLSIMVKSTPIAEMLVPVVAAAPGLFATQGSGQAAALNEDGTVNSVDNPALRGSIVTLYATGWSVAPAAAGVTVAVGVTIGGYPAVILFSGPAPGYLGLMQINARIPAGFMPPGIQPIVLAVGTAASEAGVTLAVK